MTRDEGRWFTVSHLKSKTLTLRPHDSFFFLRGMIHSKYISQISRTIKDVIIFSPNTMNGHVLFVQDKKIVETTAHIKVKKLPTDFVSKNFRWLYKILCFNQGENDIYPLSVIR